MQAAPNSPELLLLKFSPLTYHHSHFLAATLDFTSFFTMNFWGAAPFFTAWLSLIRYYFFCICILQSRSMAGFGAFLTLLFFSLPQEEEKNLKKIFNTSTIFDFIINYTNCIHIFITCQFFPIGFVCS